MPKKTSKKNIKDLSKSAILESSPVKKVVSTSAKIKTIAISLLLGLETYLITKLLMSYVETKRYFAPPMAFLAELAALILVLLYTYFLSAGAWKTWEQYVIVPVPISIGIFLATFQLDMTYALLMFFISFLLLCYDVFLATRLRNEMITFRPRFILRFSTKGILFIFSLLAGVLVLIESTQASNEINLGEKVGDVVQSQYENFVEPEINENAQRVLVNELGGKGLPIDPEIFSKLGVLTGDSNSFVGEIPGINLDLRKTVENEFNSLIEPYKQFIPPLIALVVFALIRFVGTIVHGLFNLTIDIVMKLFVSIGFLKVYHVAVKKEEIGFDSATV